MSFLKFLCCALIIMLPVSQTWLMPRNILGVTGLNPFNVIMAIAGFIVFISILEKKTKTRVLRKDFLLLYFLPLILFACVGMANFHKLPVELYDMVNYSTPFGYFRDEFIKPMFMIFSVLIVGWVVEKDFQYRMFVKCFLFSVFLLNLLFLAAFVDSGFNISVFSDNDGRGSINEKIGPHANDAGLLLSTMFCILLFMWGQSIRKSKIYIGGLAVLTFLSVILTFSRGSLLGCLVAIVFYNLVNKNYRLIFVAVISVLPAFLWVFLNLDLGRFNSNVEYGSAEEISSGRIDLIWIPVLEDVFSNPLIGSGLRSYNWSDSVIYGDAIPVGHPHNAYLQILQDFGVLLASAVIIFYIRIYKLLTRVALLINNEYGGFFLGVKYSFVVILFQGLFGGTFEISYMHSAVWVGIGLAIGVSSYQHEKI